MTWEELEEVRKGAIRIDIINEELRLLDELLLPSKQHEGTGIPTMPSSPVEQHFRKKQQLEEKLQRERDDLAEQMLYVENWLSTVTVPEVAMIVRLRFFSGYTWIRVSKKVYGEYSNASVPMNAVKRYLNHESE